ncbi:MAG: hypothetical protein SFV15_10530 [Polyangiaceae bacterium]|nr:hypothetical protein [Polyangiaceae bacterium]
MPKTNSSTHWSARFVVVSVLISGCSSALEEPPHVAAPMSAYVEVPYPPPAGFTELVPAKPAANALWIDGGWVWLGQKYAWERGGWLVPRAGATFAPWSVRYEADGRLKFAPSGWFTRDGRPLLAPSFLVSATIPTNEVTSETQSPR